MDLTHNKSSAMAMFQHQITQIKCDQRYIGSVSYFSSMVERVKQLLMFPATCKTRLNFISGKKNRNLYIKSLQIKHCQKGILSFNITIFFLLFFPVAQQRNSMALQHDSYPT